MTSRKRGGIENISTLIARAYPKREPVELLTARVLSWWGRVVPAKILKNARPVNFYRGVLTVHTTTSAWANSLQFESENLLAALQERAPEVKLKKLRFRVGSLPDIVDPPRIKTAQVKAVPLAHLPDSVARELAKIRDDRVRDAVARAAAVGLATGDKKQRGSGD
jgi:hypothetical protein